jgi:hypothetical protein
MKWSLKPSLVKAAVIKCHSNMSNALARSILRRKAWECQLFRLKEWTISWVMITLKEICLLTMKDD